MKRNVDKIIKLLAFFIVAGVLSNPLLAWAEHPTADEAREWLGKMSSAIKNLDYEGTFVYVHGSTLEALSIVHSRTAVGESERLFSLVGAAREILREDDLLTCILPDNEVVVVEKTRPRKYLPPGLLELNQRLSEYYDFRVIGSDRMTGRPATVIGVIPLDPYRYGYRLWLDNETALLLKSDMVNDEGKALEQLMFTSLKVMDRVPEEHLKPVSLDDGFKWYRGEGMTDEHMATHIAGWKVKHLPGGFRMIANSEHNLAMGRQPVEHLVYTDGLSSVSVFIEKPGAKTDEMKGVSYMGAVNAYGTIVDGYQVTVVGEVPEAAVMMIGDSVYYTDTRQKAP
ncbi:MAG TPA: transcriptional regulator [Gammaproteobacteria bacterium]|nr:transcriptional regulator [Gammaproteobacteria bacterium]